jgi:hypothetical protein
MTHLLVAIRLFFAGIPSVVALGLNLSREGSGADGPMRRHPKVGAVGEHLFLGEPKHSMDFAEHGMPAVLGTPWLSWSLEHAAREAVLPWLEPGESTVGAEIEVRHHAPPRLKPLEKLSLQQNSHTGPQRTLRHEIFQRWRSKPRTRWSQGSARSGLGETTGGTWQMGPHESPRT